MRWGSPRPWLVPSTVLYCLYLYLYCRYLVSTSSITWLLKQGWSYWLFALGLIRCIMAFGNIIIINSRYSYLSREFFYCYSNYFLFITKPGCSFRRYYLLYRHIILITVFAACIIMHIPTIVIIKFWSLGDL